MLHSVFSYVDYFAHSIGRHPVCRQPLVIGTLTMTPVPDFAGWSWRGIRPYVQVCTALDGVL